jgi:hypothetical protein
MTTDSSFNHSIAAAAAEAYQLAAARIEASSQMGARNLHSTIRPIAFFNFGFQFWFVGSKD